MQGVGNDFVVVDSAEAGFQAGPGGMQYEGLAVRLCKRRRGIGADGLLVLAREDADDRQVRFRMRMFNPDGTEDMCGNGLRCAGLWALRAGWLDELSTSAVLTKEGVRPLELLSVTPDRREATVAVGMGEPHFDPDAIPFISSDPATTEVVDLPVEVDGRLFRITALNTNSTHAVIFGPPPDEDSFRRYSPQIENHPSFPERTSVLWVTPAPDRLDMRIWERGVGETLGCGSGACAAVVAAQRLGLAPDGARVEVESRGGILAVTWPGPGRPIRMEGPATLVYEGEIDL